MPSNPTPICLDSCVIIDYLQGEKGQHSDRLPDIEPLVQNAGPDNYLIVVSALAVAEVIRANPPGEDISSRDDNKIRQFFQKEHIEVRPITREIAHSARDIARFCSINGLNKVTPPDAVHIATAIDVRATALYTYDDTHMIPQDGHHGCPPLANPLRIMEPDASRGTIFESGGDDR